MIALTIFTGWLCMNVVVVEAAELPAELMLEGVSLLKSMEYAQQQQQEQQKHHLQQQQHLPQQQQQHKQHQTPISTTQQQHLHGQTKRFAFSTTNTDGADIVDIDAIQPPALSSGDISRFERELFLASAIEDDDDATMLTDNVELPLESESMESVDLMEHTNDYKQQHPAMWLQQHNNYNNGGGGGEGKKGGNTFLKLHHPLQHEHEPQQKHHNHKQQQQQQQQPQHHKHADSNSGTLAPPPSPVAAPQRHCSIEISTKLTGICETMSPIGAACVAGDYMDVYNQDCM